MARPLHITDNKGLAMHFLVRQEKRSLYISSNVTFDLCRLQMLNIIFLSSFFTTTYITR